MSSGLGVQAALCLVGLVYNLLYVLWAWCTSYFMSSGFSVEAALYLVGLVYKLLCV